MASFTNIAQTIIARAVPKHRSEFDAAISVREEKEARYDPLRCITPYILVRMLNDWRLGYLGPLAVTMDELEERDTFLLSVIGKAKAGPARQGWEISACDDRTLSDEEADMADAQRDVLKAFYDDLEVKHATDCDQTGGMRLLFQLMMDAKCKRYSVFETIWKPDSARGLTAELKFVPLWFFENLTGRLRFLRDGYQTGSQLEGIPLKPGGWMVHVTTGLMIAAANNWMMKNLSRQDQLLLCRTYGLPITVFEVDALPGSPELAAASRAAAEVQGGSSIAVTRGTVPHLLTAATGANDPQAAIIEDLKREIATLFRGSDLATMSRTNGTGASMQGDETADIEEDDAAAMEETLHRQLTMQVLHYHFGPATKCLVRLKIKSRRKEETKVELETDSILSERGFPIPIGDIARRYNRPLPRGTDPAELLKPPAFQNLGVDNAKANPSDPSDPSEESDQSDKDKALNTAPTPPTPEPADALLTETLALALGVSASWLAPVAPIFAELQARLEDGTASHATVAVAFESAADRLPELFDQFDYDAIAAPLIAGMGTAALQGAVESIRQHRPIDPPEFAPETPATLVSA